MYILDLAVGVVGNSIVCPSLPAPDKCVVHVHRFRRSAGIAMCIVKSVILGKNTQRDPCNHHAVRSLGDAAQVGVGP
jgi:hypothetical protein